MAWYVMTQKNARLGGGAGASRVRDIVLPYVLVYMALINTDRLNGNFGSNGNLIGQYFCWVVR